MTSNLFSFPPGRGNAISNKPSLRERCEGALGGALVQRGDALFRNQGVTRPIVSDCSAQCRVADQGGRLTTEIDWTQASVSGELLAECSCDDYAYDGELCAHIWATLLSCDLHGVGAMIPGSHDLTILHEDEFLDREDEEYHHQDIQTRIVEPTWVKRFSSLTYSPRHVPSVFGAARAVRQNPRKGYYIVDRSRMIDRHSLEIQFCHKELTGTEEGSAFIPSGRALDNIGLYQDPLDREFIPLVCTNAGQPDYYRYGSASAGYEVPAAFLSDFLRRLSAAERLLMFERSSGALTKPIFLRFDSGGVWTLGIQITKVTDKDGDGFQIEGDLRRDSPDGGERMPLDQALFAVQEGVLIAENKISRVDLAGKSHWLRFLSEQAKSKVTIPAKDADRLVEILSQIPNTPTIDWPEDFAWSSTLGIPEAEVVFSVPGGEGSSRGLFADLKFHYAGISVSCMADSHALLLQPESKTIVQRDIQKEAALISLLGSIQGVKQPFKEFREDFLFQISNKDFPRIAAELLLLGWKVQAKGQVIRKCGNFEFKVSSGIDWFDLSGTAHYENGLDLNISEMLAALKRGESLIPLGDGSVGMLPEAWLKKYTAIAAMGKKAPDETEGLRFSRWQGVLLGAWLSADTAGVTVRSDADFERLRQKLANYSLLKECEPGAGFQGELRAYQKMGLAWLGFLKECEIGGILADDMGLGKTIQVLAHMSAEYAALLPSDHRPTLVVMPKSLLFNWRDEAARFAPKLRVLTYSGGARESLSREFPNQDLILVSYPTLRRDAELFARMEFHYLIADEGQAIKNAASLQHQVCAALKARHRVVMTGTPVENSLDDLFALMDFANPGLLGSSVRALSTKTKSNKIEKDTLIGLSRALQPFMLRRKKEQVLQDLPERIEKILYCEPSDDERKFYDSVLVHYRKSLSKKIESEGLAKSQFLVLEGLLRLRQAACHSGLIDAKKKGAESAKVETLLARLSEVIAEGHKALVFSQFTSFLDIVRARLDGDHIAYEYLDGQTENREDRVKNFQANPRVPVFLISLKAGGIGLNLTAADYVFILDPWWNPAVENQAIDRAHRIGQKNTVIAYRLITQGTVEEKIMELQNRKRELADAIMDGAPGGSGARGLTSEDVDFLFS